MKKSFLFTVLLQLCLSFVQAQPPLLKETAWHSSVSNLVDDKDVIKETFKENFVIKFDYETKIITLGYSDKTEAYIYTSSSFDDKNLIVYFLEDNQLYSRVALIKEKEERTIMFFSKSKNYSLLFRDAQLLYSK